MIKLKSLICENLEGVLYHITPTKNLSQIKRVGILPREPQDMKDKKAVYLFPDRISLDDAMMNWMGDRFDDDEPLSLISINPQGLNIQRSVVDFEVMTYQPIPVKNIVKIEPYE
jgi:hypothetical protein